MFLDELHKKMALDLPPNLKCVDAQRSTPLPRDFRGAGLVWLARRVCSTKLIDSEPDYYLDGRLITDR